jgi:hypothetical protein
VVIIAYFPFCVCSCVVSCRGLCVVLCNLYICMYVCMCTCFVRCNITAETNHKPARSVTYSLDQLPSLMEIYDVVSFYITK